MAFKPPGRAQTEHGLDLRQPDLVGVKHRAWARAFKLLSRPLYI
jgi:hypothetical protein